MTDAGLEHLKGLFVGFHAPGAAFMEIVALFAVIAATTIAFWPRSMAAGILMVPYLGWVSFATVLSVTIWRLNAEFPIGLAHPAPNGVSPNPLSLPIILSGSSFFRKGENVIETIQTGFPSILGYKLHGKLHHTDYKAFMPAVDAAVASEGRVRLLAQFEDFHGWDMRAMWDDFKLTRRHFADFERIAMVGDRWWEGWLATICRPFTHAEVRYFDASKVDDAWAWLREGVPPMRVQ